MSGPVVKVHYVSDTGADFSLSQTVWANSIATNALSAAFGGRPAGMKARYRMIQRTSDGREWKIMCATPASPAWTAANGSAAVPAGEGAPTGTLVYAGRLGERQLIR